MTIHDKVEKQVCAACCCGGQWAGPSAHLSVEAGERKVRKEDSRRISSHLSGNQGFPQAMSMVERDDLVLSVWKAGVPRPWVCWKDLQRGGCKEFTSRGNSGGKVMNGAEEELSAPRNSRI